MTSAWRYVLTMVVMTSSVSSMCWMGLDALVGGQQQDQRAVLLPNDPDVVEGSSLNVTCSITEPEPSLYNSSHISFIACGMHNVSQYMQITSDRSASLIIPDMRMTGTTNHCFIQCMLGPDRELVACQSAQIFRAPQQLSNMKCTLHDWSTLDCHWLPRQQLNHTKTKHQTIQLTWTLTQSTDIIITDWTTKDLKDTGNFTLDFSNFTISELSKASIAFGIEITNKFGEVSSNYRYDLADIVQLPPVRYIRLDDIKSRAAEISWDNPSSAKIIYTLTLTPWDMATLTPDTMHRQSFETANTKLSLSGLEPLTDYTVVISAQSVYGGIISQNKTTRFTTLETAPAGAPAITPGSFHIEHNDCPADNDCAEHCREITLYWKDLPLESRHAKSIQYQLSLNASSPCLLIPQYIKPRPTYIEAVSSITYTFRTCSDCEVAASLETWSTHGRQEGPPARITVPMQNNVPTVPDFLVSAINDNSIDIQWSHPEQNTQTNTKSRRTTNNDVTLTLFWCLGSTTGQKCMSEVSWQVLPAGISSWTLDLEGNHHYMAYIYGLSATRGRYSSGIVWNKCVFDTRMRALTPQIYLSSQSRASSLIVELEPAGCATHLVAVTHKLTLYCCKVDQCGAVDNNVTCRGSIEQHQLQRTEKRYSVQSLEGGSNYAVWLQANSTAGQTSSNSNVVCQEVPAPWLTWHILLGLAVLGLLVCILVIGGIITVFLYCRRMHVWYNKGVEISYPDASVREQRYSERPLTASMNEDGWPYDKQLSVDSSISADSGRGSMLRQAGLRESLPEEELDEVFIGEPLMAGVPDYSKIEETYMDDNGYVSQPHNTRPLQDTLLTEQSPHISTSKPFRSAPDIFITPTSPTHPSRPPETTIITTSSTSPSKPSAIRTNYLPNQLQNPQYVVNTPESQTDRDSSYVPMNERTVGKHPESPQSVANQHKSPQYVVNQHESPRNKNTYYNTDRKLSTDCPRQSPACIDQSDIPSGSACSVILPAMVENPCYGSGVEA